MDLTILSKEWWAFNIWNKKMKLEFIAFSSKRAMLVRQFLLTEQLLILHRVLGRVALKDWQPFRGIHGLTSSVLARLFEWHSGWVLGTPRHVYWNEFVSDWLSLRSKWLILIGEWGQWSLMDWLDLKLLGGGYLLPWLQISHFLSVRTRHFVLKSAFYQLCSKWKLFVILES